MVRYPAVALSLMLGSTAVADEIPPGNAPEIAAGVDALVAANWEEEGIAPGRLCDDQTFLRRLSLDLAGLIPTLEEARRFAEDASPHKRQEAVRRLIGGPEFALHMSHVLDRMIQGEHAGDGEFIDYLRRSLESRKSWDRLFREILLGPWDSGAGKGASRFLEKRLRSLDQLTIDTSNAFLGVNVSCARCHDHPHVDDWTQDHYYGMASFFNRTYEHKQGKEKFIGEKGRGEVEFVDEDGKKRTAKMMFVSGRVIDEPPAAGAKNASSKPGKDEKSPQYAPPPFSRREQFVRATLEERQFFSRALVNRLWRYFLGRGLVEPVDQMHSENPPAVPGVLDHLAEHFAASGHDLGQLVESIVLSRTYQLASRWHGPGEKPAAKYFAVASVRPLTPRQYAFSLVLAATGATGEEQGESADAAVARYREIEQRAQALLGDGSLDDPGAAFQSSVTEALFLSNHPAIQKLLDMRPGALVERLAALESPAAAVEEACWHLYGRPPDAEERSHLESWLEARQHPSVEAVRGMLWAMLTAAEFRFNH